MLRGADSVVPSYCLTVSVDLPLEYILATLCQPLIHLSHFPIYKNRRMSFPWQSPVLSGFCSCSVLWGFSTTQYCPGHRVRLGIQCRISTGWTTIEKKTPSASLSSFPLSISTSWSPGLIKQDIVKVTEMPPTQGC